MQSIKFQHTKFVHYLSSEFLILQHYCIWQHLCSWAWTYQPFTPWSPKSSIMSGLSMPIVASTPTRMMVQLSSLVWLKWQEDLEWGCARHSTCTVESTRRREVGHVTAVVQNVAWPIANASWTLTTFNLHVHDHNLGRPWFVRCWEICQDGGHACHISRTRPIRTYLEWSLYLVGDNWKKINAPTGNVRSDEV